ncbi:unnamed protein product [Gadus morhua 'NCC']
MGTLKARSWLATNWDQRDRDGHIRGRARPPADRVESQPSREATKMREEQEWERGPKQTGARRAKDDGAVLFSRCQAWKCVPGAMWTAAAASVQPILGMYSLDGAQLPRGALSNRLDGEHGKDDDEDSDEQNDNHDAGKDKERRRNVS